MSKIRAIEIIKTFSKKEKSDFKDFISTGYFNKTKKLVELYDIILNNLENITSNDISEEKLFTALFKKNKFSYSFTRNMMSEMLSLCEKFLIVNKFNQEDFNDYTANRILLTEFSLRFLDNNFRSKIKKLRQDVKKLKIHSEYYDMLSTIEGKDVTFDLYRSSMKNVTLKILQRSEYNLCVITQLLEFDITDLTVNTLAYNLNFESELLTEFIKNLDIKNFLKFLKEKRSPLQDELEMRLRLILISTDQDNVENYFILKKLILKRIDQYSNVEKFNLLIKLKNYCSVRVYKGDLKFRDEKFELAKIEVENIEYNADGVGPLYAIVYIETIQKALIEKDRHFANHYIKKFTNQLEKAKQETMYNLALALLSFHDKKFEKTLLHLSGVNPFSASTKIICKTLSLKTYYELNSLESGLSLLDAYIHFIKTTDDFTVNRKKVLKENYDAFKKLFKIKSNSEKFTKYDLSQFANEISEENIYKEWFQEKINELELGS